MKDHLAALREEYTRAGLSEADLAPDPFAMFSRWFTDAGELPEPNAMVLATVSLSGQPSSRIVLSDTKITHIGGPTTLIEVAAGASSPSDLPPPGKRYFFGWGTTSRRRSAHRSSPRAGEIDAVLVATTTTATTSTPPRVHCSRIGAPRHTTKKAAQRLGDNSVGLTPGSTTTLKRPDKPSLTITATPCRHGPAGMDPITGPVVGFALNWEGQQHGELWVTGDTVLYADSAKSRSASRSDPW